jgi:hypothetical protein
MRRSWEQSPYLAALADQIPDGIHAEMSQRCNDRTIKKALSTANGARGWALALALARQKRRRDLLPILLRPSCG